MSLHVDSFVKLSKHVGYFKHLTNVGVIETKDGIYLVDCADTNETAKTLANSLKTLFPQKELLAILCTHGHPDHTDSANYLQTNTGCKVIAPQIENVFMENPSLLTDLYWGGRAFNALHTPLFQGQNPCKVDSFLEGTPINDQELFAKCIALPGHFYNQMGIIVKEKTDGTTIFFVADAFFSAGTLKKSWIPFMQDPEAFRESIQTILDTKADFYLPSHGELCNVDRMHALAELNIMITYELEDIILRLLKEKPLTQDELLKKIADFADIKMKLRQTILVSCTLRSYLSSLYNRGQITVEAKENKLVWSNTETSK